MEILAQISFALAAVPAVLLLANAVFFRRTPHSRGGSTLAPRVSILIPARDEEQSIAGCLEAVLRSEGVDLEVLVLDDHSLDRTAEIVGAVSARDTRVRLLQGPELPSGWNGKQHACWNLARAARGEWLLFLDADVTLQPDAAARLVAAARRSGAQLVSGFPRQITGTWLEHLLIPLIHFVLLGFLPLVGMRFSGRPSFAAGCGQLFLVEAQSYFSAGGHRALRDSRHDGIQLPRAFRRAGLRTDLVDATDLACCRMYRGAAQVWNGLAKNATEGMASRVGIVVWTVLLFGGQVLPFALIALALGPASSPAGANAFVPLLLAACTLALTTRALLALWFRQSVLGVLLHPLSVTLLLAVQIYARLCAEMGQPISWKGRVSA